MLNEETLSYSNHMLNEVKSNSMLMQSMIFSYSVINSQNNLASKSFKRLYIFFSVNIDDRTIKNLTRIITEVFKR